MDRFTSENTLKDIFSTSFCSEFEFQWEESVGSFFITVDHDSAENTQLTAWTHPVVVDDVLEVLEQDVVHFEN